MKRGKTVMRNCLLLSVAVLAACTSPYQKDGTSCPAAVCSDHGTCEDSTGVIACNCAPGYGGPTCSTCYPGYSPTDAGTCEPGQTCGPSSCSFAGACAADGGVTSCSCNTGYTGATCATCATGYHRGAGYACVADETCAANQCGPHGSCTVSGGVAGCTCDTGWAGLACDACYPGYHVAAVDGGTTCTLDVSCDSTTCRGNGTCAQDGGVVSNACGAGQCIDTAQGYICLCPGIDGGSGQWGNSCP
jgi:hypothetical protein